MASQSEAENQETNSELKLPKGLLNAHFIVKKEKTRKNIRKFNRKFDKCLHNFLTKNHADAYHHPQKYCHSIESQHEMILQMVKTYVDHAGTNYKTMTSPYRQQYRHPDIDLDLEGLDPYEDHFLEIDQSPIQLFMKKYLPLVTNLVLGLIRYNIIDVILEHAIELYTPADLKFFYPPLEWSFSKGQFMKFLEVMMFSIRNWKGAFKILQNLEQYKMFMDKFPSFYGRKFRLLKPLPPMPSVDSGKVLTLEDFPKLKSGEFLHGQRDIKKIQKLERDFMTSHLSCGGCGKKQNAENVLLKCSRCGLVYYCDKNCQKKHWKAGHKKECISL